MASSRAHRFAAFAGDAAVLHRAGKDVKVDCDRSYGGCQENSEEKCRRQTIRHEVYLSLPSALTIYARLCHIVPGAAKSNSIQLQT
jgi:hypothetical protein